MVATKRLRDPRLRFAALRAGPAWQALAQAAGARLAQRENQRPIAGRGCGSDICLREPSDPIPLWFLFPASLKSFAPSKHLDEIAVLLTRRHGAFGEQRAFFQIAHFTGESRRVRVVGH